MNEHIEQYLDYYIDLKISPEYALLLRGNWGSGKTWFIKNYLKKKPEIKHLYVSLNGISSFDQIEDIFFQQLHPVLASKGMKLAGKIFRGVLKTAIKVDLNSDGKEDGSISSSIPEVKLPEYLKNLDSKILVFDDLERCAIPIPTILGYINQFVEINGQKVIILANENEIITRDDKQSIDTIKYLTIKEKIIGRSFDIHSDLINALETFIGQISNKKNAEWIDTIKSIIITQFEYAGFGNLRHLKQSILDFDRFLDHLPSESGNKPKLFIHLVELFFSISFEIKKGSIPETEIQKIFSIDFGQPKDAEKTPAQIIRGKYPVLNHYPQPLDISLLESFFRYGTVNRDKLRVSILSSGYFLEENTPDWIKLWYYFEMNDDDFEKLSKKIISRFNNYEIKNRDELVQIVGTLMRISEHGLISINKKQILKKAKENIDKLEKVGLLKRKVHEEFPIMDSHGLTTHAKSTTEFREFFEYAKSQSRKADEESHSEEALKVLKKLSGSLWEFRELITLTNFGKESYFSVPILKYIPVDQFLLVFFKLSNKDKRDLGRVLRDRYGSLNQFPDLLSELDWLVFLYKSLEKEKVKYKNTLTGMMIDDTVYQLLRTLLRIFKLRSLLEFERDYA